MEPQGTAGGGGGGSGGPAPFLQKTYEMVDDSSSDAIVSWGSKRNTFVVWDPLEFARVLLPSYFKHSNFSSFIRQLNTYGFRKVDQEKWEFSNEDFVRGEKHRLRNIHRRKPIHSHSHGHSHPVGTLDSERATLEEEIDRLSKERDRLRNELCGIGHLEVSSGFRFDEAEQRMDGMMQRQDKLVIFLEKAVRNPAFVEQLIAVDFSVLSKKRRSLERGGVDGSPEVVDNSNNEGHSSTSKPVDLSNLFPQDFSNKLKLELCPAVSNGDMALGGTRNSNEGRGSSPQRVGVEGQANTAECHLLLPEEVDLMDTSVPSLCQKRSNCLPWLPSTDDEEERNISCQLKLTLASSPLDLDEAQLPDKFPKLMDQNAEEATDSRYRDVGKDDSFDRGTKGRNNNGDRAVGMATSIPVASSMANKQGNVPGAGRVNDVFWEQFLTERPGSSDNEEASSCLRSSTREEGMMEGSETWMNRKDMGAMKL